VAISAVIGGLEACHGQIDAEREFPCRDWDREERQTPPKIIGVGAGAEDVVRICPDAWIRASAGDHEEPSQVPNLIASVELRHLWPIASTLPAPCPGDDHPTVLSTTDYRTMYE
jgi:hypothetical protein